MSDMDLQDLFFVLKGFHFVSILSSHAILPVCFAWTGNVYYVPLYIGII